MTVTMRAIEVEEATALEKGAADLGVSVAELLAEFADFMAPSSADLAVLNARWAEVEAGEATVPHAEVDAWLQTWGTPDYRPWRER